MAIVNQHIETKPPYNGLSPNVLNVPAQYVAFPAVSASSGVYSTANHLTATNNLNNGTVAPGTQPNVARNIVVLLSPNTGSASLYSGGSIVVVGKDYFGSTRSEAFPVTALNAVSAPRLGSVNFASLDAISFRSVGLHTGSSSAASAVSVYVGYGQKIGLPINLILTNGVHAVHVGSAQFLTSAGASSSQNNYTVCTGAPHVNGVIVNGNLNAASAFQVGYVNLGSRMPVSPIR